MPGDFNRRANLAFSDSAPRHLGLRHRLGAQPEVDIVIDGTPIKAVAQVSKTGFTYVFDRLTGEPVWPIEERPVPPSTVPGERLHPTQPFPTRPLPFEQIGITEDDLIDFTPELRAEAERIASEYVIGPIFTPTIVAGQDGKRSTIVVPGAGGGANFPGASLDPETSVLYIPSVTRPTGMSLVEPPPGASDWPYVIRYDRTAGPQGLPLLKPPYRRITAIDLNTGLNTFSWSADSFRQGPHGPIITATTSSPDLESRPLG